MTLEEKLKSIDKPAVLPLGTGNPTSVEELWRTFIEPRLPKKEIVLQWHRVLMEYIRQSNAVFPVRGYASPERGYATKGLKKYDTLRRGFLTQTSDSYRFFYTDNFHVAYYLKLAVDGYVPSVQELLSAYKRRVFPARFGTDTSEERELMAMPRGGKNPGFTLAGYMIAHVFDVGKEYYENGKRLSLKRDILDIYYPRGEREDWEVVCDCTGDYYLRELDVKPIAKKYMIAAFLRFVHPFNYFLMPKRTVCSIDISGQESLLQYVKSKFRELYGPAYEEFLTLIMPESSCVRAVLNVKLKNYQYGDVVESTTLSTIDSSQKKFTHPADIPHNQYSEMKVGELARKVLSIKLQNISLQEAEKFTIPSHSKSVFNLNFPLLSTERVLDHTGVHRYYKNPIFIQGHKFYLTSQWYENQQRITLIHWLATH